MPSKKVNCTVCGIDCHSRKDPPHCRKCGSFLRRKRKGSIYEYRRQHHMMKKFGIDLDGFSLLWEVFEGKCAICKNMLTLPTNTRGQSLSCAVIDHDHETGNLRGLLCNGCNKGLGLFKDSSSILKLASEYLYNAKTSNDT